MLLSRLYRVHHKKHVETLTTNSPIHKYTNRINNRLVFKIKCGYQLEVQMPETMKLFSRPKKLISKSKHGEHVPIVELVGVVLFQCNLVYNQHQQNLEVLYTFTPSRSDAHLLNIEPNNLLFLKKYDTDLDDIIITFSHQNGPT